MRIAAWIGGLGLAAAIAGCGGGPPVAAAVPAEPAVDAAAPDVAPPEPQPADPPAGAVARAAPDPSPASTMTFEQATSVPEPLDPNDDRPHVTDAQLTEPMRGVLASCRVPANAKVTIKTAVQNGRAIGVTVLVALDRPRPPRRMSRAQAKAQAAQAKADAKTIKAIVTCADRNVRALTWPSSPRRDSFTTVF